MYHSCMHKRKIIWERTGIFLGHDQISMLCEMWGCMNSDEFMNKLNKMSDEELKKWLEKLRKKKKILDIYLQQEAKIYA